MSSEDRKHSLSIRKHVTVLILSAFLAAGCGETDDRLTEISANLTPAPALPAAQPDGEAEEIALCLSGELIAPQHLYDRIHQDISCIRAHYGGDYELLNTIGFIPPWTTYMIIIMFDEHTGRKVTAGEYNAWDSLNTALGAVEWERLFLDWWRLYFSGRMHPKRLSELYRQLPGVLFSEANSCVYTFYNIFPCLVCNGADTLISYTFGRGRGDCYAGCLFDEYWYFVSDGVDVRFIGHWDHFEKPAVYEDHISVPPDPFWLERAIRSRADYDNFR